MITKKLKSKSCGEVSCGQCNWEREESANLIGQIFRLIGIPEGDMGALENYVQENERMKNEILRMCQVMESMRCELEECQEQLSAFSVANG